MQLQEAWLARATNRCDGEGGGRSHRGKKEHRSQHCLRGLRVGLPDTELIDLLLKCLACPGWGDFFNELYRPYDSQNTKNSNEIDFINLKLLVINWMNILATTHPQLTI